MTSQKDIEEREPQLANLVNGWPTKKEIPTLWSLIECAYDKGFSGGWKRGVKFACEEFSKSVERAKNG